jgi:hypothetical protein
MSSLLERAEFIVRKTKHSVVPSVWCTTAVIVAVGMMHGNMWHGVDISSVLPRAVLCLKRKLQFCM